MGVIGKVSTGIVGLGLVAASCNVYNNVTDREDGNDLVEKSNELWARACAPSEVIRPAQSPQELTCQLGGALELGGHNRELGVAAFRLITSQVTLQAIGDERQQAEVFGSWIETANGPSKQSADLSRITPPNCAPLAVNLDIGGSLVVASALPGTDKIPGAEGLFGAYTYAITEGNGLKFLGMKDAGSFVPDPLTLERLNQQGAVYRPTNAPNQQPTQLHDGVYRPGEIAPGGPAVAMTAGNKRFTARLPAAGRPGPVPARSASVAA